MVTLLAVLVGCMLGSFLSVLIGRWPQFRGVATGRSLCPACGHVLAWYDLIPLVSWLWLRGACRYCAIRIPPFYLVLELVMGAVMGSYVFRYGIPSGWHILDIVILFGLVSLFFFDLKHQMLPDVIVLPLGVLGLTRLWFIPGLSPVAGVVTGLAVAAVFAALYAFSRGRWLGFGDVKLALVIGLLFGFPDAVGVTLIAVWAGALAGIVLLGLHRATMTTALPFGSFWTAVAVVTLVWPVPALVVGRLFFPFLR